MKIRKIKQALKGNDPVRSMFNLIPEKKIEEFKEFAIRFGYSRKSINDAIKRYRYENEES